MTKTKPLYHGDQDATLTICPKKLRRHLPSDLLYLSVPEDSTDDEPKLQVTDIPLPHTVGAICKHCKADPVIVRPTED